MSEKLNNKEMKLSSKAFQEGGVIPTRYTGRGKDESPELILENIHPAAKSLVVMLDDLDIPFVHRYNHWIIWNIPVCNAIPEAIRHGEQITDPFNAVQGMAYGRHCYRGPKPPRFIKKSHRYVFTAYALDCICDLPSDTKKNAWLKVMKDHILDQASLSGTFCNADAEVENRRDGK